MKTSIEHLPETKQKDILEILEIIKEVANPEKVILFGSHASGAWVEDEYKENGINFTYNSDYDFLVVLGHQDKKEQAIITGVENRTANYKNSVSVIIHRADYINEGLSIGQYFFTDIINKGIVLFDTGNYSFLKPKELTPAEERKKAQDYFDTWYPKGVSFLKGANFYLQDNDLSSGVFLLHQSVECFYSAVLLVFFGYKPKTHNLHKLRNYSKHISSELYAIFRTPVLDENEYNLFDLLKRGYIEARYKPNYTISVIEMNQLIERVSKMQFIVKIICEIKIAELLGTN